MLHFRKATLEDGPLYFDWVNDPIVRQQSYNSAAIDLESHTKWFARKVKDSHCVLLLFLNDDEVIVGQVRMEQQDKNNALIGISVDAHSRGKGYAKEMIASATNFYLELHPNFMIHAYIKEENLSSKYAFEKAGFDFKEIIKYEGFDSYHYIKE